MPSPDEFERLVMASMYGEVEEKQPPAGPRQLQQCLEASLGDSRPTRRPRLRGRELGVVVAALESAGKVVTGVQIAPDGTMTIQVDPVPARMIATTTDGGTAAVIPLRR